MNTDKKEFYESRFAIAILFVFCLIMDFFSIGSIMSTCSNNTAGINGSIFVYIILFVGMTVFAFLKLISTFRPYITIDDFRLQHKGRSFMWQQIKQVSLARRPYINKSPLYLKLELNHRKYWINLRFISDSARRQILDTIESHIPVQYDFGCKYNSHEQTIIMGICLFIFIFIWATLLFVFANMFING